MTRMDDPHKVERYFYIGEFGVIVIAPFIYLANLAA